MILLVYRLYLVLYKLKQCEF